MATPLQELLLTERSYCAALNALVKFYLDPFPLRHDVGVVFGNVAAIRDLHIVMLKQLEDAAGNPLAVAAVFAKNGAFLKIYIQYCNK